MDDRARKTRLISARGRLFTEREGASGSGCGDLASRSKVLVRVMEEARTELVARTIVAEIRPSQHKKG
jgi:hypothetical protein